MKVYRDYLGFIEIDRLPIKKVEEISSFNSFTFLLNGERYYFKELKNTSQCYNELIGYELARDFGFNAVPYDMASYDGFCGYLSKNYMKDSYVFLEDILIKYYSYTRNKCNLNDVIIAISEKYSKSVVENLRIELVKLLMFDIIIANYDRHDRNIIIDEERGCLAPISDNEMLLSDDAMFEHYYCFKIKESDAYALDGLLEYLSDEELKFFLKKVEIINKDNIASVMERVEKRIGCPMINVLKAELVKRFNINYSYLLRAIKKEIESRMTLKKK